MRKKNDGAELKLALARVERGRGKRVPAELKLRAAEYARERREAGAGCHEIGQELGLSPETTRRWSLLAGTTVGRRMVPVEVVAEQGRAVVISPSGYRVEGLELHELVTLLRALS